ncbi:MAG: septal ring lytic transglycosylase RlpA family protein [Pseudomonadota bacterium]
MNRILLAAAAFSLSLSAASADVIQSGKASWYKMGHTTANGESYDPDGLTAAHRTLPFNTRVKVRDRSSGREVVVRINDRGPFVGNRVIDLSRGAAREIGMINKGITSVDIIALN